MFARQAKLDGPSWRNKFERPFPSRWACRKVSHQRSILKSSDQQDLRTAPAASILPRRTKRRVRSRNARRLPLPQNAIMTFPPLRAPITAPAAESARYCRAIRSSPRGELIPNSNTTRGAGCLPLSVRKLVWSAAGRAHRAHNRYARGYPPATPTTPLQMRSGGAPQDRIFRDAPLQQVFPGPTIPCGVRNSRIPISCLQKSGHDTSSRHLAAPISQFPRLHVYGGSLQAPESPSRRRPPNWGRAQEFSSRGPVSLAPHSFSDRALKFFGRQFERYPAAVHRHGGELDVANIPHIFFRAEQRIGLATRGSKFQVSHFPGVIDMVIGKGTLPHHLKSPPSKVVEECGRISDSAKSQKACARPVLWRQGHRKLRNAKHIFQFR